MKNIAILGSTGSIGTQALDVVRAHPEDFRVVVLAANQQDELFQKQVEEFSPEFAVLSDEAAYARLKARYHGKTELAGGRAAFIDGAAHPTADIVLTSMMGFAGLEPTMKALEAKKDIALANKETLVVAGELVMRRAAEMGCKILPVDSEHGAFFQCLQGEDRKKIEKLLLTASGGPFRERTRAEMQNVTKSQVLAHPTWVMGQKITVDSATLMNKGLEVIEAKWLYGVEYEQIEVVVHPQSIVHSMVQFVDGSVIAQLGTTDMRLPIQYALSYPERISSPLKRLDFWAMKELTFEKPDTDTFKGLRFAYEAGAMGGSAPCVMNAANEIAVEAFLKDEIHFLDIYEVIEETMLKRPTILEPSLDELFAEDAWARQFARDVLEKRKR